MTLSNADVNSRAANDSPQPTQNKLTVSEKERRAINILKHSTIFSGLGHCTNCFQKLMQNEKRAIEERYATIDKMYSLTLDRRLFESFLTQRVMADVKDRLEHEKAGE